MRRIGAVLAAVALGLSLTAGSAAARPAKAKVVVKPNTAITNGMKLTVRARQLAPGFARRPIYECNAAYKPPRLGACTLVKYNSYTNGDGSLRARVEAIVGPVGTNGGTCDADHSCLIVTFTTATTKRPVSASISFAP